MPILPALTALSPVLGSVAASAANVLNVQNANKQNIALWEKQNAYNHPAQQMARLKEAGLNPNLIYGSSASGGIASPAPKQEAPRVENPLESINSTTLLRLQMMREQTDLIKAQRELAITNESLAQRKTEGQVIANQIKDRYEKYYFGNEQQQKSELRDRDILLKDTSISYLQRTENARVDQAINQAKISALTAEQKHTYMPVLQLEAALAKAGLRPSDPLYMRAMVALSKWMYDQGILPLNMNYNPQNK